MKKFILGLIIGLLLPLVCGYLFIKMGGMPMAASGATPLPMEEKVADMALTSATAKSIDKTSPVPADEINLTQGAQVYVANCAFCHGLPGQHATSAAKGMFPLPPQFLNKDELMTDDPVGRSYWIISNGIRLTGMPGFTGMLSDTQIWQLSQLIKNADKLPASTQAELTKPAEAPAPTSPAQPEPQKSKKK